MNSLHLAKKKGIRSVAFPAISTGIFGYPLEEAADISLRTVINFIQDNNLPEIVRFVLFGEKDYKVFTKAFQKIISSKDF